MIEHAAVRGCSPQLRLSLVVSAQKGAADVPHCVVPPVHEKMHVPMLQMVIADGSVGHTLPHLPLHTTTTAPVSMHNTDQSSRLSRPPLLDGRQ
jgi:hypothetical protein